MRIISKVSSYTLLIIICVAVAFPVYWMFLTAVSAESDMYSANPPLFPLKMETRAINNLLTEGKAIKWIQNTLIVAVTSMAATAIISIFSGYSISRFKYRGKTLFSALLLVTQMLPQALIIVPIYIIFNYLDLLNSLFGLVLINCAFNIPIATWVLKGYFDTVPPEIEEAALMDGCNHIQTLFRVVLPSATPAVIAVSVIVFIEAWNEFLFSSTMITVQDKWVASVGLASFVGMFTVPIEQMMAGALLFTLPIVVFYFALQRYIVSGLTSGAVKG